MTKVERLTQTQNKESGRSNSKKNGSVLTNRNEMSFKFCLAHELSKGYSFADMKNQGKELDTLLKDCCGKTISQVENLFMRKKGHGSKFYRDTFDGKEREVFHFGKDRKAFRIHGYYNDDGYFVICKIDANHSHKYNK